MYRCDYCSKSVGPSVPLNLIAADVDMRQIEYVNLNEDGESVVVGRGTEITKEYKQCPECAGVKHIPKSKAPLPTLCEPLARTFTQSLAACAVENLLDRVGHASARAKADFAQAYPLLKNYEQRGGGL